MVKSYLIIAFRNFLRNKNYTLINLLGLSIGITSCLILFLIIRYDLNFDKFHSKYASIHRIVQESSSSSGTEFSSATPYPLIKGFRNDFPEIPLTTQMHFEGEGIIRIDESKFKVEDLLFADSLFFDVFDFKALSGNPRQDLAEPGKAFVTPTLAHKIGYQVNTPLRVKINNLIEVEVVGLVEEPPATSHIQYSMIVSMSSFTGDFIGGMPIDTWNLTSAGFSYIVLPESMPATKVQAQMKGFVKKYYNEKEGKDRAYKLQQLKDIHFDEQFTENPSGTTNASYSDLVVMCVLGAFILVIACINFINLSTALAIKKSKEIGIRKTLGAKRSQLTFYFLGETFLLTLLSVLISLGLVEWMLPWLNHFLEKRISLDLFGDPMLMLFIVGLVFCTTVLSGFYPALILSGFNPIAVLKNKITAQGSTSAEVRKVLVVFQFMIAQCLIIGTLVIADQMEYFKTKNLGFDKDAVIGISMPDNKRETLESFRTRLESTANISSISFSIGAPTSTNNFGTGYFLSEGDSKDVFVVSVKPVDRHYLKTYGIKLVAGRWFTESDEKLADPLLPREQQQHVYIMNESAVKQLGFNKPEDILGKSVTTGVNRIKSEVVGVVNDFHVSSLHDEIKPVILMNFPEFYYEAGIKVNAGQLRETVKYIEAQWTELYPDSYFEYFFLDEELAKLYRQDERTFTLFKVFAGVSIFIGCLGLYGLISFMANQKLKEVGIRKVMGASVASIVMLFSKDFIRLIIIAFLIAAPLAWYFMSQWLQGFAYHIDIHWSVFVISILSTLCIALLTVSYRSIKAAVSNPSETLRTE